MALCFICFNNPGAFQTKYVLAQEVRSATEQGYVPSQWNKSPAEWNTRVAKQGGTNWFICGNCYEELQSFSA